MKFKLAVFATVLGLFVAGFFLLENKNETPPHPAPTNDPKYRPDQVENEGDSNAREAWMELIHKAAPGTDWQEMDRQAARQLAKERKKKIGGATSRSIEVFANGHLEAEWSERGSSNQSGSMRTVTYVPELDQIFGVADGGSLWRGNLDGSDWTVLNDDFLLHPEVLESFYPNDSTNVRLVGASGKTLMTSDDQGQTWTEANFNPDFYDGWGSPRQVAILSDSAQTVYYLAHTWDSDPWAPRLWLYQSVDGGLNFERIHIFQHEWQNRISMWTPHGSEQLYIVDQSKDFYEVENDEVMLLHDTIGLPAEVNIMLSGHLSDSTLTLYALLDRHEIYRSIDNGASWNLQGETPNNAWAVGMSCSPFDAETLVTGAVNASHSYDGGVTWEFANEWWEYYDNLDQLHADIMDFKFFEKTDGTPFLLIANHGGLHVSYDNFASTENIALDGMNIGQYYDVLTNPVQTNYIYLGSQDQGWQWTDSGDEPTVSAFTQQWSGDYGQQLFTRDNQSFWTQYPGGIMDYYHFPFNPPTPWPESEWSLPGEDKPAVGWIVPTANLEAFPEGNLVFVGGGSLDGGPGSHLILLTAGSSPPYNISEYEYSYDFKENSNTGDGLISAIEQPAFDEDRIYVTTDDGTFFRTLDGGTTWEKSPGFTGPMASWIYTACILASKQDPETVWISGSGYSNPPVYKSTDAGMTWEPMSLGLPNTLVQQIVATPDDSMLFAATTLGPFVYVEAEGEWFPLLGEQTPLQWYTDVEYVEADTLVRFATFGRGVWDLKFFTEPEPPSANEEVNANLAVDVFPNPVPNNGSLNVFIDSQKQLEFALYNLDGKLVRQMPMVQKLALNLDGLISGTYFFRISENGKTLATGKQLIE